MKKTSAIQKRIIFLILLIFLASFFSLIYLSLTGNADQVYNDIIVECTSIFSSNKSAEKNLLFLLIFVGMIVYATFYLSTRKMWKDDNTELKKPSPTQKSKEFMCALVAMSATYLVIFGNNYPIIITAIFYAVILSMFDFELVNTGICTYFFSVYTFIALYRIYVFCGGNISANNMEIAFFAFVISMIPLGFEDKKRSLIHLSMVETFIIPFSLLIFLSNKYKYGNEFNIIDVSAEIKFVIWIIIFLFILEAMIAVIKHWKMPSKIDEAITLGSCIAIMAYNRFDGTGAIMSTDLHHPFENIIGYSQIFQLGQVPFKNYIPVSGMYSIIQGAVFDLFGDGGTFANYYITNNLFYLFVIIIIAALLKTQIEMSYVLLISLIFYVQTYNRLVFMLPIMLLLICPKLLAKKNAWLMTWILTSLFQGLYYPLYGVATCLAFLPLGIWQLVTYVKSGDLKNNMRKPVFWIGWIICAILIISCIDLLLGTLRHMLAMSGQSILADGISRFGQLVPDWFFSFLGNEHLEIRLALYYLFTFMIPVALVWVAFALTLNLADIQLTNKKIIINNPKVACTVASVVIMPIICYTYTIIRLDIDSIYARSASVLFTSMVLILVFTRNYLNNERLKLLLISIMISIPAVINTEGIFATEAHAKLTAYYTVPDEYIYVENDPIKKLGTGYINQEIYSEIQNVYTRFENKDKSLSYMGDPAWFGYFYLMDIKGDGAMEIASTVKSYSAAKETIEIARANQSVIGPLFTPFNNYYLYHWLLASGEYYWDEEQWEFIPNNGIYSKDEIIRQNKNNGIASWDMDLAKTASSWGSSMDSLEDLFTDPGIEFDMRLEGNTTIVDFPDSFDGDEADFVYLEFPNMESNFEYTLFNLNGEITQEGSLLGKYLMKKNYNPDMTVHIGWQDENGEFHSMIGKMSKGKLLFPVGAGSKWLFNQHSYISIQVYQDDQEIPTPEISNIRFLKIREVK